MEQKKKNLKKLKELNDCNLLKHLDSQSVLQLKRKFVPSYLNSVKKKALNEGRKPPRGAIKTMIQFSPP